MKRQFQAFERQQGQELSPSQLLEKIDAWPRWSKSTAYYNTVVAVLMRVYNGLLKGQFGRLGLDYERFDLTGGFEELEAFDPSLTLGPAVADLSLDGSGTAGTHQAAAMPSSPLCQVRRHFIAGLSSFSSGSAI